MEWNTKRFAALAAAAALLLSLLSCGSRPAPDASTGSDESAGPPTGAALTTGSPAADDTGEPSPALIDVIRDQKSSYRLVYGQTGDIRTVGSYLRYIREQTGCMLRDTDDSLPPSDRPEILFGETNRRESIDLYATLGPREYAAEVVNGQIVLAGSDAYALSLAFSAFCRAAQCDTGFAIAENFAVRGSYTLPGDSYPVAVTDQANLEITVYDLAGGALEEDAVIKRLPAFSSVGYEAAGMRFREWQGRRVMLAVGRYHAEMVDWESGELLWQYTGDLIWNAHAVELLPNGVIAVAGSTGNSLAFFDSTDGENKNPVRLEMTDAHGVVWDPDQALLWACGGNRLRAFSVELTNGTIAVNEQTSRAVTLPETGAHDLQPIYGRQGLYWVSTAKSLLIFNSVTGEVSAAELDGVEQGGIKGIGNFADGVLVQTVANGSAESWNTDRILMYLYHEELDCYVMLPLISPSDALYKLRVVNFQYH